jgi:hypothetical protein
MVSNTKKGHLLIKNNQIFVKLENTFENALTYIKDLIERMNVDE